MSQFRLLREQRFRPFFLTQFLGAFNDNLFKNALVVLLTFQAASWTTIAPALLANLAAGIFILPFFLFSATAGQLADKYDKARLTRLVKVLEIAIMLVALAGLAMQGMPARKVGANFSSSPQIGKLKALMWTARPRRGTRIWVPAKPPLRPSGIAGPSWTMLPDGSSLAPTPA